MGTDRKTGNHRIDKPGLTAGCQVIHIWRSGCLQGGSPSEGGDATVTQAVKDNQYAFVVFNHGAKLSIRAV
jgi:hypothetical protein